MIERLRKKWLCFRIGHQSQGNITSAVRKTIWEERRAYVAFCENCQHFFISSEVVTPARLGDVPNKKG